MVTLARKDFAAAQKHPSGTESAIEMLRRAPLANRMNKMQVTPSPSAGKPERVDPNKMSPAEIWELMEMDPRFR